jgi:DNA-binding PadR family transcriptional regulator
MSMKDLTKLEELVMMAIWKLKENAYGVEIKKKVQKLSGKEYFYNTLYTTFEQLNRKAYITKHFGEPSAVRGGKRKVYFRITRRGFDALENAFKQNTMLWSGVDEDSFRKEIS